MNRKIYIRALREEAAKLLDAADVLENLSMIPLELSDEFTAVSPKLFQEAIKQSLKEVNGNKVVSLNDLCQNIFGHSVEIDPLGYSGLDFDKS